VFREDAGIEVDNSRLFNSDQSEIVRSCGRTSLSPTPKRYAGSSALHRNAAAGELFATRVMAATVLREPWPSHTAADDTRTASHRARKAVRAQRTPKDSHMNLKVLSGEGLRFYGVAYGPGEVIPDVPEPVADQWIRSGLAEEVNVQRASKSARKLK
jgi:hypothetical protein